MQDAVVLADHRPVLRNEINMLRDRVEQLPDAVVLPAAAHTENDPPAGQPADHVVISGIQVVSSVSEERPVDVGRDEPDPADSVLADGILMAADHYSLLTYTIISQHQDCRHMGRMKVHASAPAPEALFSFRQGGKSLLDREGSCPGSSILIPAGARKLAGQGRLLPHKLIFLSGRSYTVF